MEQTLDSPEWQNIPAIIPETIFKLQQQLLEMDQKYQQAVKPSKGDIWNQFENIQQNITDHQSTHQNTQGKLVQLNDWCESLQKEFKKFSEKEFTEAIVQTEMTAVKADDNNDISDEDISEEQLSEDEPGVDQLAQALGMKKEIAPNMLKPRMYSIDTFQKLVTKYLNRSNLKSTIIKQQKNTLPQLNQAISDLQSQISNITQDFRLEIQRVFERMDFEKTATEKLFEEVNSKFKELSNWSKTVDREFQDFLRIQQDVKEKNEELLQSYDTVKQFTKKVEDRLKESTKDIMERLTERVDGRFSDIGGQFQEVHDKINQAQELLQQEIKGTNEQITQKIEQDCEIILESANNLTNEARSEIEVQILDYRRIQESDLERFEKNFNEQKVDMNERLRNVEYLIKDQRGTLDKFIKTEIQPAHIAEARLYAIEARLKVEETARLEQDHFLKDFLRKLVFSLEQMNITIAAQNPKMENDQNMYLYLKRLNFLKKLVQYSVEETYSPKPFRGRSTGSRFSRSLIGTTPDINRGESRFRDMHTAFQ